MVLKEFRLEIIPFNQIGLNSVHFSNLRLFEYRARDELTKEVGKRGGGGSVAVVVGELRGNICRAGEE